MHKILTLDTIRPVGLERLPRDLYEVASEFRNPDAILVRSFDLHNWPVPESVVAVARAGAGVNNIPVEALTRRGIAVFNTPGANANAVKELVLAGMLIAARNLCQAWEFSRGLDGTDEDIDHRVELDKTRFIGTELPGRTLGVIGLGAIGVRVANAAESLGMRVVGFDPHITVDNAWRLSASVQQVMSVSRLLAESDFVSLHVPMVEDTRHLINGERLRQARPGLTLLNFARAGVVDEQAVLGALEAGALHAYVCDFPSGRLNRHRRVIALPHLGASTIEAQDNCAGMAAEQIREFLEHGTLKNSVNFPAMEMPRAEGCRLLIINANVPHMIERITAAIARMDINIIDMLNRSRSEVACTLIDVACPLPPSVVEEIGAIDGVWRVRVV